MSEKRQVAMVTAASKGIGYAVAQELAQRGYAVALLARSTDIVSKAEKLGGLGVVGSVTEPNDLAKFFGATFERFGRIDAVVNNTGHPPKGDLLALTDEQWLDGTNLILMSVIRLARLVIPTMQEAKRGAFVNISSFAAVTPELVNPVSPTLRAGLAAFTKLFSQRYAVDGIRMNSVLPGFIDSYPEDSNRVASIPLGRYGRTDELAKNVCYLISSEASYITGQSILVDGGLVRAI